MLTSKSTRRRQAKRCQLDVHQARITVVEYDNTKLTVQRIPDSGGVVPVDNAASSLFEDKRIYEGDTNICYVSDAAAIYRVFRK